MQFLVYVSRLKHRALRSAGCIYTYPGGTPSISERWVVSLWSGRTGSVAGGGGAHRDGGAPVPLGLQRVCGCFAVPLWLGRQPFVWFSHTIARCLSIAAFTLSRPRNITPTFFSSRPSAGCYLNCCCVSSIKAWETLPLAISTIFKARRMSECSSCTWPLCLAIVGDMLKTYKKVFAASKVRFGYYLNHIGLCSLL